MKYDRLIIELQKDGKAKASISIEAQTLKTIQENHETTIADVVGDMITKMEEGLNDRENETSKQINS
tara:strand:- start:582 stop:782 length:201 start_codon:yes stop_codon:yes gene_type:complete